MISYMNGVSNTAYILARKTYFQNKWSNFENVEHDAISGVAVVADNTDIEECEKDDAIKNHGNEVMVSDKCDPLSAEFLHVISKENV